ncbi:alkane 1-monooxygenase [Tabrizicola sp. DMG-N-6]|uniref:Alkane 1-monooxygenase n=2 Tax=Szabonella alba TaxID=2804194 RepID=A0A8K0Y1B0_9RHOB|nr:alkane 1-monooxygenase [Szabonella alba]
MALFALASGLPAGLIALAALLGGGWVWLPFLYMAFLTVMLDQIIPLVAPEAPEGAEFPAADALLVALGLAHLCLLPLVVHAVAGQNGLSMGQRVLLFFGAGLWFGQVANPAAHELIHRGNRWMFRLGVAVYGSVLFGHHASAHRLVHHVHAATATDPNTARAGEGFWRFAPRAWTGSFRAGWQAESARQARRGGLHPYATYLGLGLGSLIAGAMIAGLPGVLVWAGLAAHVQLQLLLADYVQHYGLTRATLPDGRLEPVSDRHSWNAPQWYSSALMLNAPRHSDHHAHPARPYPALRLPGRDQAPRLPYPLPVCATLALSPRLWRRVMGPRLAEWQRQSGTDRG